MITTFLHEFGRYLILMKTMFAPPENARMYWKETIRQMNDIGIGSLGIITLIALFIGAVTAVQFAYQLSDSFIPAYYIGYIVRDSTIIELAPTISALVLAGKVGSNIAAEIGGMRQKEQIDALEIMGVNTAAYLVGPKIFAGCIVIPLLIIIAAGVSILGGYLAAVSSGFVTANDYIYGVHAFFEEYYVFMMLVKAVVFAFILTSVACYKGYYVKNGSIELGRSSTQAVVLSNIFILLADYIIALVLT